MDAYSHRKGTKTVRFTHKDGAPVKDAAVRVRQTRHEFLFGCAAFDAIRAANGEADAAVEAKIGKALELFNFITLPFYWGRFEPERGRPDTERLKKAAAWLKERGCAVKGHPLCWHTVTAQWLLGMPVQDILDVQLARIRRDVSDFAGLIDMWDVINELVIMPVFDKYDNGITQICREYGRIGLAKRVFAQARESNPGALLLINDFNMSESYDILLEGLLEAGLPIDAIGLQSHMHQGCWSCEKTDEILQRFSKFGLPIHFTEINMVSGRLMPPDIEDLNDYQVKEWPSTPEGEQRQAEAAAAFYKQLFAHPLVKAITWWNFEDGGWLNAPAGLVTAEGREKPAYRSIYNLVNGEWRTPETTVKTGGDGMAEVTGFKGRYTAEFDGGSMEFDI